MALRWSGLQQQGKEMGIVHNILTVSDEVSPRMWHTYQSQELLMVQRKPQVAHSASCTYNICLNLGSLLTDQPSMS